MRLGRSHPTARGESGFLLVTTLAIILFFTVTLVAILSMTMTAAITTSKRVQRGEVLRLADSALENVVNARRLDRVHASNGTTPGVACPGTTTVGLIANAYQQLMTRADGGTEQVAVSCAGMSTTSGREFVLRSYVRGDLKGMAAVRLDDQAGPGQSLLICDWQLGANAGTPPATCP